VQLAEAVCARAPRELDALSDLATELACRSEALRQATQFAEANRLRHEEFFDALPGKTGALEQEINQFGSAIDEFASSLETARRAIVAARQDDARKIREQLQFDPVNADSLTAYLLHDWLATPLEELAGWLHLTRQMAPGGLAATRTRIRGEDIAFAGYRPAPNVLIRELQLQGMARFAGRSLALSGLLTEATNNPARHVAPIRLRLTSGGSVPLDLQATIDRTGAMPRDQLLVDCRGFATKELHLGRTGEFGLTMSPSTAALSISVAVEGSKLSGEIQLVQEQLAVGPILQGELSAVPLANLLQTSLGQTNSVVTRVSLKGTLGKPSCTLWCNLGPVVAEAMDRAVRAAGEARSRDLVAEARRHVDERLAGLERQFADERTKIAAQLIVASDRLETIARAQKPGLRIQVEQLGRRLPENSLFR
jgi:uncharacterized protein (TIGR03545 family)